MIKLIGENKKNLNIHFSKKVDCNNDFIDEKTIFSTYSFKIFMPGVKYSTNKGR